MSRTSVLGARTLSALLLALSLPIAAQSPDAPNAEALKKEAQRLDGLSAAKQ